jgi:hypothetical protein
MKRFRTIPAVLFALLAMGLLLLARKSQALSVTQPLPSSASCFLWGCQPPHFNVQAYIFYGDWGCSECTDSKENHVTASGFVQIGADSGTEALSFLRSLAASHTGLEVHAYEVWMNTTSIAPFRRIAAAYSVTPSGVPTIFIGERVWQGFDAQIGEEIATYVEQCLYRSCPDLAANRN